jgi:ER membrane protein complex subunit 1
VQNLPEYLAHFAKRFATGSYESVSTPASPLNPANATSLSRDAYGLKKIIVAATPFGNVFGIDSSTGNVVWTRVFGLGWAAEVGGRVLPVKLFVTKSAAEGKPEVVLVTQRRAENVSNHFLTRYIQPEVLTRFEMDRPSLILSFSTWMH